MAVQWGACKDAAAISCSEGDLEAALASADYPKVEFATPAVEEVTQETSNAMEVSHPSLPKSGLGRLEPLIRTPLGTSLRTPLRTPLRT